MRIAAFEVRDDERAEFARLSVFNTSYAPDSVADLQHMAFYTREAVDQMVSGAVDAVLGAIR